MFYKIDAGRDRDLDTLHTGILIVVEINRISSLVFSLFFKACHDDAFIPANVFHSGVNISL